VKNASNTTLLNLACNGLYYGGGANIMPATKFADQTTFVMAVTGCNPAYGGRLTLGPANALQAGSARECTTAGCPLGPPIPVPNPASIATSTCLVVDFADEATGRAICDGDAVVNLPLTAKLYLAADLLPAEPGIQPCPICTGTPGAETCKGGPNNGLTCTPGSSDLGDAYPTSGDCPPPPATLVRTVNVGATVNTVEATDVATASGGQTRVFCGVCWDNDASNGDGGPGRCSLDPSWTCANDSQCSGAGKGVCQGPPVTCASDVDCAADPVSRESCRQRSNGTFAASTASTVALTGAPAGCLADGASHPATLVGQMCITPTFNAAVDSAADLPGPAAASLQGVMQLLP
jgi:hypothetical protein